MVIRGTSATMTFKSSPALLKYAASLHEDVISSLTSKIGADQFLSTMILQPIPRSYAQVSQRKGGNMMGTERIESDAVAWTGGVAVPGNDTIMAVAEAEFLAMTATLRESAASEGALTDWVYMNYAHPSQNPLGGYGVENVAFMKNIAARYDPEGFMQRRVPGGFKLARVA